jgi:hypothetical protein
MAKLPVAVLTAVALIFVLVLSTVGENNLSSSLGGQTNGSTSQTVASTSPAANDACVAPSRPPPSVAAAGFVGPPAFTFVGANSTCITVAPSASGPSSAIGSFTLNAPNSTFLALLIAPPVIGMTLVPSGTNFTATVGSQSFRVQEGSDPFYASPLVPIPRGNTTFQIKVSVPNPHPVGTYEIMILISSFQDSTQAGETYGNYIPVNLVFQ